MKTIPVNSSDLHAAGYDNTHKIMQIEFNNGGIYLYYDVPEHIYRSLLSAHSHGKYFHAYIKDVYRYKRIH